MATRKPIENPSNKLNPALYMAWDRVFMIYGSTLNGLQHVLTEKNWQETCEQAWHFSEVMVRDLVERLYAENELPTIEEGEKEIPL